MNPSSSATSNGALVTHAWCERTGGALTASERRHLWRETVRTLGQTGKGLLRLATGRRSTSPLALPQAPDAKLVDEVLEFARDQGPVVEGHGLRTWLFGGMLAASDGVDLDDELFCVAAIVHDAGALQAVVGQDFTLRSAIIAVDAFAHMGRSLDSDRETSLRDGIVAHATAGVTVHDSPLGAYIQAGAMLDLTGLRLEDLPEAMVDEVFQRHPSKGVRATILRLIDEEAKAVPDGRFAFVRRAGLPLAVKLSPSQRGRD